MSVTRDNALAISPHYERDLSRWEPAAGNVAARRLTGLVQSPIRAADPGMGAFGRGEGAFYSPDGGKTWAEDTGLPSLEVADMAASLRPDGTVGLYAALPEGVWWRRWDSVTWEQVDERPTRLLALPRSSRLPHRQQWQGMTAPYPSHALACGTGSA